MTQDCPDILSPEQFEAFFKKFYWLQGPRLDKYDILADLSMQDVRCSFRTAAQKFHIIDEQGQRPVIVRYGDGADLIKVLEQSKPKRNLMRRLQRYIVNIPRYVHASLLENGAIRELHPGIYVQALPSMYDEAFGFCPDKLILGPDELVV